MTGGWLMDAVCAHGEIWYGCDACGEELGELLAAIDPSDIPLQDWDP